MEIRLRPELEELVKQDVQRGAYETVEQEAWLAANRAEIRDKIDEGYASAQRGELIGPDEVRSRLAELKRKPSGHQQG
jgi:predicted transcriptional regulator